MGNFFYEAVRNIVIKNANFKTLAGFSISAILLWLTVRSSGLQLQDLSLKGVEWLYFSGAIVLFIFATWVQSLRSKLLWMNDSVKFKDIHTYNSLLIGNFYNCLLPGNLGEGVRTWHFSRKNKKTVSASLAAIITEKWIDAQMFVGLVLILFSMQPFTNHYIFLIISVIAIAVVVFSVVQILMWRYKFVEKWLWHLVLIFKRPGRFLFKIYKHTRVQISNVYRNGFAAYYIFLCIMTLLLNVLQFFLLLKAADVTEPVGGMYSSFFIAISMMIIAFIPSAPGNIGVLHYGLYMVLILSAEQYGIHPASADLKSYAFFGVLAHVSYFIPEVALGVLLVIKDKKLLFG